MVLTIIGKLTDWASKIKLEVCTFVEAIKAVALGKHLVLNPLNDRYIHTNICTVCTYAYVNDSKGGI